MHKHGNCFMLLFAELQVKFAVALLRNVSMQAEPKLKKKDLKYCLCS